MLFPAPFCPMIPSASPRLLRSSHHATPRSRPSFHAGDALFGPSPLETSPLLTRDRCDTFGNAIELKVNHELCKIGHRGLNPFEIKIRDDQ